MIWLVWRRQRAALLTAAGLVAAYCIVLVAGRVALVAHRQAHGLAEPCIDVPSEACRSTATAALMGTEPVTFALFWGPSELVLLAVPLAVGLLAGTGLFQRELDEGTTVLALTQSVTVTRWWATGLLVSGVPVVLILVPLGLVAGWAYAPFELIHSVSPLETPLFESSGLAPIAYGLLAFVLAAGTGLVARGNLAPVVVTVTGYVVAMFVLATVARPQYLPAETVRQAGRLHSDRRGHQGRPRLDGRAPVGRRAGRSAHQHRLRRREPTPRSVSARHRHQWLRGAHATGQQVLGVPAHRGRDPHGAVGRGADAHPPAVPLAREGPHRPARTMISPTSVTIARPAVRREDHRNAR